MGTGAIPQGDEESIYSELRRLAAFHLRHRAPEASLQPTALVNETWLRLARQPWKSRSHFMALASSAMRHVLVDYVRARLAEKRGRDWTHVSIEARGEPEDITISLVQVLGVHEALERLVNITLGRAYARVAEHYISIGRRELARPAVREAAAIRDALLAGDSKSPAVVNFRRRVDTLDKTLNAP